jgi:hypothetical protein
MVSGLSSPDPSMSASAFEYPSSVADIQHNPYRLTRQLHGIPQRNIKIDRLIGNMEK